MKRIRKRKFFVALLFSIAIMAIMPAMASAHCDTMDGPVIADAQKAIEANNVSYVLKWVSPESEKEVAQAFELTMKVRKQSPEAKELADRYFFENLVRIHRAGEGVAYTGVQPHGAPIDEKVLAADKSIESGNLSPLEKIVPHEMMPELQKRFDKVMALKNFDVNDVEAGREYIEAYVSFFHFAEGEDAHANEEAGHTNEDTHGQNGVEAVQTNEAEHTASKSNDVQASATGDLHNEQSQKAAETLPIIPWSLAGLLFVTTLIFGIGYYRKTSK